MKLDADKSYTIGETYKPAMEMTDPDEAAAYFEELVRWSMQAGKVDRPRAEVIQRANLGYFAGYYDNDTRLRVERLFKCSHPVFGTAVDGAPTAQEAFEMGSKMAGK